MSYESYIPDVKDDIDKAVSDILDFAGLEIQRVARPLAPVDKGRLRQSITFVKETDRVYVGSTVDYAGYVEYGTVKQKAQPYLKPAFLNSIETINSKAREKFNDINK